MLFVFLALLVIIHYLTLIESSSLSVHLTAKWRSTPVLEVGKFYANTSPKQFWEYVSSKNKSEYINNEFVSISLSAGEFIAEVEGQTRLSQNLRKSLNFKDCPSDAWIAMEDGSGGVIATCKIEELSVVSKDAGACTVSSAKLAILPSDLIHPRSSTKANSRNVIVHGDLESDGFHRLWEKGVQLAMSTDDITLVLRMETPKFSTSNIGGFSALLDIKNTEYVAVDRSLQLNKKDAALDEEVEGSLESGIYFSTLMKRFSDNQEVTTKLQSFKATLKKNREKVKTWEITDLSIQIALDSIGSKDPLQTLQNVTENLPSHIRRLARIPIDDSIRGILSNKGKKVTGTTLWMNGVLLDITEDFGEILKSIRMDAHLSKLAEATGFSRSDFLTWLSKSSTSSAWGSRFDVRKFAKGAVNFVNDIEKDGMYSSWPKSLSELQTSVAPLVNIRRNLYTCILVLNPEDQSQMEMLQILRYFVRVGAPIRFGLVFTSNSLAATYGKELGEIQMDNVTPCNDDDCSSARCLVRLYAAAKKESGIDAALSALMSLSNSKSSSCSEAVEVFAQTLAEETGAWSSQKFVKIGNKALSGESMGETETVVRKMARYVGALGLPVPSTTFNGAIATGQGRLDRILQTILFQEQALLKQQDLSDVEDILSQILRLSKAKSRNSKRVNVPASKQEFLLLDKKKDLSPMKYLTLSKGTPTVTIWLPVSASSSFCETARAVIQILREEENIRVAFLGATSEVDELVEKQEISELEALFQQCPTFPKLDTVVILPKNTLIVCNGRVIVKDDEEEDVGLSLEDIRLLVDTERTKLTVVPTSASSDDFLVVGGILGSYSKFLVGPAQPTDAPKQFKYVDTESLSASWKQPQIVIHVDPLDHLTSRAAAIASWLRTQIHASITINFHPEVNVGQLPQASYHRWAPNGTAFFSALPPDQLLTLKLVTSSSWIVFPSTIDRDPDNLLMSEGSLNATYDIAHVLVDGHASNENGEPAAGMQMELVEYSGLISSNIEEEKNIEKVADSLVMYNLGYWQMKAKPGVWRVKPIRGYELVGINQERIVEYLSYAGPGPIELKVRKLDPQISRKRTLVDDGDTMHVFSLASGALYERFLRIMMLSVRKRSSGKIKFWLLENYMSATMKAILPKFSAKYNFEYELVTFKWPDWLRGQSERQRQIWGMKILFLDVLFPLHVKRVIYVDSDQVLRSDLRELWNLDLKGAPYAMTPFCDSRKETLGFQFWRQGYWAGHLRGRPYHISALFVVDLIKFRDEAVGDRLRAVYQQLSADPNSLSNLDQDLPNFAQHDIPIFSLPQDWLWCESWCSDSSKTTAKTIDLCNNPLHKEPKLEMAKRVINGPLFQESWDELDSEVASLQ